MGEKSTDLLGGLRGFDERESVVLACVSTQKLDGRMTGYVVVAAPSPEPASETRPASGKRVLARKEQPAQTGCTRPWRFPVSWLCICYDLSLPWLLLVDAGHAHFMCRTLTAMHYASLTLA